MYSNIPRALQAILSKTSEEIAFEDETDLMNVQTRWNVPRATLRWSLNAAHKGYAQYPL